MMDKNYLLNTLRIIFIGVYFIISLSSCAMLLEMHTYQKECSDEFGYKMPLPTPIDDIFTIQEDIEAVGKSMGYRVTEINREAKTITLSKISSLIENFYQDKHMKIYTFFLQDAGKTLKMNIAIKSRGLCVNPGKMAYADAYSFEKRLLASLNKLQKKDVYHASK